MDNIKELQEKIKRYELELDLAEEAEKAYIDKIERLEKAVENYFNTSCRLKAENEQLRADNIGLKKMIESPKEENEKPKNASIFVHGLGKNEYKQLSEILGFLWCINYITDTKLADLAGDYAEDLQEILSEIEVLNE